MAITINVQCDRLDCQHNDNTCRCKKGLYNDVPRVIQIDENGKCKDYYHIDEED